MFKRSFFERLTGISNDSDEEILDETELEVEDDSSSIEQPGDGELSVDMFETGNAIIIQTITAGVRKEDLDISLTRTRLSIRGIRKQPSHDHNAVPLVTELYWGPFSRVIDLPDEISIDEARASESHGMLTLVLPKFDKNREMRIKVQP